MDEPNIKTKTPVWPVITLFLSVLIFTPVSIIMGMGGSALGFYITLGVPFILGIISASTYLKRIIKKDANFYDKFYLVISGFLIFPLLILQFRYLYLIWVIKRMFFYLSLTAPTQSILFYTVIPFLLLLVMAYGIASIFESKKRILGIIITVII